MASSSISRDSETGAPVVTVGVRFHDASLMPLLERCLASINAQTGVRTSILLALQGFDQKALNATRQCCDRTLVSRHTRYRILNVGNPEGRDLRATLLNRIIEEHHSVGESEYLTFIDFDDIWFQTALRTLVDGLMIGACALSYCDVHCADVYHDNGRVFLRNIRDHFRISVKSKRSLLTGNFLPLHSYMFHTGRLSRDDLRYDESLVRLEDYELLLRIAARHPFSGVYRNRLIGLYNFYALRDGFGNSTSNIFSGGADSRDRSDWQSSTEALLRKTAGISWTDFFGEEWVL